MSTQAEFDARRLELAAEEAAGAAAEAERIAAREAWIEAFPAWFRTLTVQQQIAWMNEGGSPQIPHKLPLEWELVIEENLTSIAYPILREHFPGATKVVFVQRDHHSTQPDPFGGCLSIRFGNESIVLVERAGHYHPVPFRYHPVRKEWERTFQEPRRVPGFACPVEAVKWLQGFVAKVSALEGQMDGRMGNSARSVPSVPAEWQCYSAE